MTIVVENSAPPGNAVSPRNRILLIYLLRILGIALAVCALIYGLQLRDELWMDASTIHYTDDIKNAYAQGSAVVNEAMDLAIADGSPSSSISADGQISWPYLLRGFLKRYDTVVEQRSADNRYTLDYTPARLLVASCWARYVRRVDPHLYGLTIQDPRPLLRLNTACDITAAVLLFWLVRHWIRRTHPDAQEWAWRLGLLAALISWFNPSTLIDAHMWPQWDVWIVPCYLGAMCLGSIEWWFMAGMCVGVGMMFKGQVLMVAPVLFLWPLLKGNWFGAMRIVLGCIFAGTLVVSPWLARNVEAWIWIGSVLLVSALLVAVGRRDNISLRAGRRYWPIWSFIPILALVVLPCGFSNPAAWALGVAVVITPWIARRVPRLGSGVWIAVIATACIVIAAFAFAGTWSWYKVGFEFPTRKDLTMGTGGHNLAVIIEQTYHWEVTDIVCHLGRIPITMKTLLISVYSVTLILCAIGAAVNDRRNSARVLISLTAPWVLMFTILPQMQDRYLFWAAALCGVAVASSFWMSLLHLFIIAQSTMMIFRKMIPPARQEIMPTTFRSVVATHPILPWFFLIPAVIYLFAAAIPKRKKSGNATITLTDSPIDFPSDRSYALGNANEASQAVGSAGAIPADPK